MAWIDAKGRINPDKYYYHWSRIIKVECGCGKIHTFKKVKTNKR